MVRSFRWNGRKPHGTSSSRERHDHARRPSSNTAIASFARDAEPGAWDQPENGREWRKRATVEDLKTGPKAPHSTTVSEAEEAMVVAFRRHTLLPLDDCLYALQPSIPPGSAAPLPFSGTAYPVCRTSRAISRSGSASSATRSASFTWISPRCRPPKASCTCSSAPTAPASLRSPSQPVDKADRRTARPSSTRRQAILERFRFYSATPKTTARCVTSGLTLRMP
jgi:hypothetical protein